MPKMADLLRTGQVSYPYWADTRARREVDDAIESSKVSAESIYAEYLLRNGGDERKALKDAQRKKRELDRRIVELDDQLHNMLTENVAELIHEVPVVDVTNIYQLLQRQDQRVDKLGCILPRWKRCWMELRVNFDGKPNGAGAFIQWNEDSRILSVSQYGIANDVVMGPMRRFHFELDDNGIARDWREDELDGSAATMEAIGELPWGEGPNMPDAEAYSAAKNWLGPFFMALALMHCKNVRLEKGVPPGPLSKKWQKKTGKPLVEWTNVVIEVPGTVVRRETAARRAAASDDEAEARRLHIVQGHFSEYGEKYGKGKLFGRLDGRYWVPSHVRGDAAEGVLAHDYKLASSDG